MNLMAELQRSNLDPQVVSMLSALVNQSQQDTQQLQQFSERIERDAAYIKTADLTIAALTLELAHHRRIRFANKSEAFTPEQRELFQETWNVDLAAIEAEVDSVAEQIAPITGRAKKPHPTGRQSLPTHLPRIEHRHEPDSCSCKSCGADLVKIGEDVSEQLDVKPAQFFVHRHIRPQYACRMCETVTAAPIPAAVIQGSLGAPGLHAWVAVHLSPFAGEILGSPTVVPHRTNQRPLWGADCAFDLSRMGRSHRRGVTAFGGSLSGITPPTYHTACR